MGLADLIAIPNIAARLKVPENKTKQRTKQPTPDGRGSSLGPSSSPTTRSMAKRIQEDWDSATDGREMFLYMFKEDHKM